MDNKLMENWQDYSKTAMASAKELEVLNTQIVEKLTGKQMELANVAFETGTKYLNSLTEIKGYQDLLAEQTKLATEFNEKLIETARGTADILTESREAYQAWMEKSMKFMSDNADFTIPGMPSLTPAKKPAAKKAA
ncbi:MAG: phasin family protein [Gammaproteobacteria bacterium]